MKAISYIPSKDEMILKFRPVSGKPTQKLGRFRLWWDNEGKFHAISIMPYKEELEEFRKNLNVMQLGGIWKGIKITEDDIKEIQEDLLKKLEEKW